MSCERCEAEEMNSSDPGKYEHTCKRSPGCDAPWEHDYLCTVRVVYRVRAKSFEDAKQQLMLDGVKLRRIEAWTVDHVEIDAPNGVCFQCGGALIPGCCETDQKGDERAEA